MPYDRDFFFESVRESLFNGVLTQRQVDGLNYLLDAWEKYFEEKAKADGRQWLAYALATTFHETAFTIAPIEEYGKGSGKPYGEVVAPHYQAYYGRGFVQLTWADNYKRGEQMLRESYGLDVPLYQYAHRALEHEPAAMVLFDGSIKGWFTGVGLPKFFSVAKKIEDPYNARKVINALDHAETIKGYYFKFRDGLRLMP